MSTALADLHAEIAGCVRCPLAATRTTVVVGSGTARRAADAGRRGAGLPRGPSRACPFVGAAGQLLDRLLGEIGLSRAEVFVANVLKCRPPGNRDPEPAEIDSCRGYLERQVELVAPLVIGSLGNFATRLLSGRQVGITRVHGSPLRITVGAQRTVLYPLYHPAAALRTPAMMAALRDDLARLPELFERPPASPRGPLPNPTARPPSASRSSPPPRRSPRSSACSETWGRSSTRRAWPPAPPRSRPSCGRATSCTCAASSAAGKTTFVRHAAAALGVQEPVTSPTFAIAHRYGGGRRAASRTSTCTARSA